MEFEVVNACLSSEDCPEVPTAFLNNDSCLDVAETESLLAI